MNNKRVTLAEFIIFLQKHVELYDKEIQYVDFSWAHLDDLSIFEDGKAGMIIITG